MTRALAITLALSIAVTAVAIWFNLTVQPTEGPDHFWGHLFSQAAFASWLIAAMLWCTNRVVESSRGGLRKVSGKVDKLEEHLGKVEEVVGEIDKERTAANAVVVQLFKDRRVR